MENSTEKFTLKYLIIISPLLLALQACDDGELADQLDDITDASRIGNPGTIINLLDNPDQQNLHGVDYIHMPQTEDDDAYYSDSKGIRAWVT